MINYLGLDQTTPVGAFNAGHANCMHIDWWGALRPRNERNDNNNIIMQVMPKFVNNLFIGVLHNTPNCIVVYLSGAN